MITTTRVGAGDDLDQLVEDINRAAWDDANALSTYRVQSLIAYLERQDTVFVVCYRMSSTERTLLGFASARLEIKPYDEERWLYVDEVDVCANHRNVGVGKAIMQKLLEIARTAGCNEAWLGTEAENHAANGLYKSLDPEEVEKVIGYTYRLGE